MKLPAREFAGLSLGIEMVLSVVIAGAAGRWFDQRFKSEPTFLILGVAIGAAAGFRQMWRFMERMDRLNNPPEVPADPKRDSERLTP
jgi:F0F1-type ATP synthase assembly protein I